MVNYKKQPNIGQRFRETHDPYPQYRSMDNYITNEDLVREFSDLSNRASKDYPEIAAAEIEFLRNLTDGKYKVLPQNYIDIEQGMFGEPWYEENDPTAFKRTDDKIYYAEGIGRGSTYKAEKVDALTNQMSQYEPYNAPGDPRWWDYMGLPRPYVGEDKGFMGKDSLLKRIIDRSSI